MRKGNIFLSLGLILLLAFAFILQSRKIAVVTLLISVLCYLLPKVILLFKYKIEKPKKNYANESTDESKQTEYLLKKSLITQNEKPYFETIKKIIEPHYIIQPQINLASIIDKKSPDKFRNELFRNIDFGIFDQNYKPLLLIEINDESHLTPSRKERDKKVHAICKDAGIPMITLWTKYGVNEAYINKRLCEFLLLEKNNQPLELHTSKQQEKTDSPTEER